MNRELFEGKAFQWQRGYGMFAVCRSKANTLIRYIQNQQVHHRGEAFLKEYPRLLREAGIEYDDTFLFQPLA